MKKLLLITLFPLSLLAGDIRTNLILSTPLLLSASVDFSFPPPAGSAASTVLSLEGGIGGGKVSLGVDSLSSANAVRFGAKAALLQTWIEPVTVDSDQLYLGAEAQLGIQRLVASLGLYRRIEGDDDRWLTTVGIGLRF